MPQAQTPPTPAAGQQQAQNPLDQLRDIHLPDQVDQFLYAPGWWIILALIIMGACFWVYKKLEFKKSIKLLIPARKELNQLRQLPEQQVNAKAIAELSGLLKRICLIYFSKAQVASLNGSQWLSFLNEQFAQNTKDEEQTNLTLFTDADIELFTNAAYQKSPTIKPQEWHALLDSSEQCIKAIIISAAKNRQKRSSKITNRSNA